MPQYPVLLKLDLFKQSLGTFSDVAVLPCSVHTCASFKDMHVLASCFFKFILP